MRRVAEEKNIGRAEEKGKSRQSGEMRIGRNTEDISASTLAPNEGEPFKGSGERRMRSASRSGLQKTIKTIKILGVNTNEITQGSAVSPIQYTSCEQGFEGIFTCH